MRAGRTRRRRLRRRRWGRIDRLQLRNGGWTLEARIRLRQRHAITLEPAVDVGYSTEASGGRSAAVIAEPHLHVERTRIEVDRLRSQRFRQAGADRTRETERRGMNGAERAKRSDDRAALGHAGLPRQTRRQDPDIRSMSARAAAQNALNQKERRKRGQRPSTQRYHHPSRPRLHATLPRLSKRAAVARMRQVCYCRINLANALTAAVVLRRLANASTHRGWDVRPNRRYSALCTAGVAFFNQTASDGTAIVVRDPDAPSDVDRAVSRSAGLESPALPAHCSPRRRRFACARRMRRGPPLADALDHMSQGLCMFDAAGRIVICNRPLSAHVQPCRRTW